MVLLALPRTASADAGCPLKIAVTQNLAAPQHGWSEGHDKLPVELAGVTVFDGPPEQLASLVPDAGADTADTTSDIWNLEANERGYWLTCHYASTTVTLTRQLPATATRCEVVYEKELHFAGGAAVVRSVACTPGSW
jgi:hypothetical protein